MVLVGALVAVLDAITELGDFEELQHVDRGIHLQIHSQTHCISFIHQAFVEKNHYTRARL